MSDLANFWAMLSRGARWSLSIGVAVICCAMAVATYAALRTPYAVLFTDLADRDAAVMVQELDKLKVPYEFGAEGKSLLVPQSRVHKTRLALMAKPLPLHGTVGFELFNNADFGVSDYVQKINFLRALQGELTRTILSIEQIDSARVHLALPDQGLFKKDQQKAKASVTLVMKPGQSLAPTQVAGIQRLVSASVAEINAEDVTVLDQHGAPLSHLAESEPGAFGAMSGTRVDLENHLARKATQVLDQWLGVGEAVVSVTADLSNQQARVTTEEVLAATPAQGDQLAAGVLVRERSVTREAAGAEGPAAGKTGGSSTSIDRDYANGKRVAQTTTPAGALMRLHVAVVVRHVLSESDVARARELVAAAVGLQSDRGDFLAVHSIDGLSASRMVLDGGGPAIASPDSPAPSSRAPSAPTPGQPGAGSMLNVPSALALLTAAVLFILTAGLAWRLRGRASAARPRVVPAATLSADERELVLEQLRHWLTSPAAEDSANHR